MTNLPAKHSLPAQQRGAVSIAIAMLIIFILTAAVTGVLKMSGSSVIDAAQNDEQVSALFLAESGLERAMATLRAAALTNSYTNTTCTGLIGQSVGLGGGTFTYTNAVSTPATCTSGSCAECLVTVKGMITGTTSSRTIQGQLIATQQNGTTGQTNTSCPTANCTADIKMTMAVPTAPSFAFVHILFNSTSNWGGADVTPTCKDTGTGSLIACTLAWNISGNYYNNPSSIGVYAPIATAGNYSLTEQVLASLPPPAGETSRSNYAAVGAIFRSGGGTPGFVGSFAKSPITSGDFPTKHVTTCGSANTTDPRTQPLPQTDCSPNDYQHAYLPASDISTDYWTCLPRVQEGGNTQNPVWDTTPRLVQGGECGYAAGRIWRETLLPRKNWYIS